MRDIGVGETVGTRDKIQEIGRLADVLASHRANGKRIVHCHGVFDLVHIGHVRHFEQARRFGDVLVVTVTPDRYVGKGPHRPVFTEHLRAEAVAALECVDYVAINQWPTAVEAIELLRPHVYAKGSEYRNAKDDRTGGIVLEEAAIASVGGEIAFTDDITFSSSNLINRHTEILPKEVRDYLAGFTARYRSDDVLGYIDRIQPLRVLTVGEAIIDEYQYCEAIGKSAKDPMLALKYLSTEKFAGGILAVANHLANFCEGVGVATFLGAERPQEEFILERMNPKIARSFLYRSDSPTIVKRRFVERYWFTKLLEVYDINDSALQRQDNEALCEVLDREVPRYDAVVVVDFGHDMLSRDAIDILCAKAKFLAVNAQSNAGNLGYHSISRYPRADYVCVAEHEARLELRDRRGDLRQVILDISRRLHCGRVVVTRGKYGCLCYGAEEGFTEVPAFATQVVDRVGAGDAFLSITAPCVQREAPMEVVGMIGNAFGALAVETVGHRTSIDRIPLLRHLESLMK